MKQYSFEKIREKDLKRLSQLAFEDMQDFFQRKEKYKPYEKRVLCVALCQGAALHYIDQKTGINDFDVWTFFEKHPTVNLYQKRCGQKDFGDSRFGKSSNKPSFVGKRVDLLWRAIKSKPHEDVIESLQRYLSEGKKSAKYLSQKAVILLWPEKYCGQIVWPYS